MSSVPYYLNIPNGPDNPSADWPPMQTNTNSINTLFGIDHYSFNIPGGGWHNQSTYPNRSGSPTTTLGQVAVFGTNFTPGQPIQLCYVHDNTGNVFAITGNKDPIKMANGLSSLIGNMYAQWGFNSAVSSGSFAGGNATGTVTFPSAFASTAFVVVPVPTFSNAAGAPGDTGTVTVNTSTLGASTFSWSFRSNSHDYTGFYWIAIGA